MSKNIIAGILCATALVTSIVPALAHRADPPKSVAQSWTTTYFDQQSKNGR